jgi:hypothetical protein
MEPPSPQVVCGLFAHPLFLPPALSLRQLPTRGIIFPCSEQTLRKLCHRFLLCNAFLAQLKSDQCFLRDVWAGPFSLQTWCFIE